MRTPYRTVDGYQKIQNDEALFFAKHGYAYVIQDCRGKNDSEGTYRPFQDDDARDGYDTLAWCATQDWSNGSLGTIGASYSAWNQWTAATLKPPGLKAMICTVSLPDPVLNVPYQNGALVLWMAQWMALIEGKRNTTTSLYDTEKLFRHLPLKTMDEEFGRRSRIWQEWVQHPSADEYWRRAFYEDKLSRVNLPVLHISGWYDDDVIGTHLNYLGMTSSRRSRSTRKSQKLIIGPWPHHVNSTRKIGEIDFGESALIDLRTVKLRWFDRWLKGIKNGIEREPKVDLFTLGSNSVEEPGPLATTRRWFRPRTTCTARARLTGHSATGSWLQGSPLKTSSSDTYCYDPAYPVPNIDDMGQGAEGPFDQRPIERRDDVLVYSTPPLAREVEVSGPVTVGLFASTSARDTDFWAQLVDVYPSGYSMHLTEGIVRGRYNRSLAREELLRPGRVYEFKIDLWVINNSFMKGHRIRLDVSSSSFPKYDRNPNTGHPFGQDSVLLVAEQTVFHDLGRPSRVVLPIVPKGR